MNADIIQNWIALSFWPGLGPKTWSKIVTQHTDPRHILQNPEKFLPKNTLSSPMADTSDLLLRAEKEMKIAEKNKIGIVTLSDPEYPAALLNIQAPPLVLYSRGQFDLVKTPCLAIVGTRYPSPYGREMAGRFAGELAAVYQFTIVSGLALGIDAVAHRHALEKGGRSIAVLGCGLDHNYPFTNRKVRMNLEKNGLVLSEFPWGTPPRPAHFPQRNRIISGLSAGVFLIEARPKSGALITVNHALDYGREIFALPGPINSETSIAPLELIQQGAVPVIRTEDIVQALPALRQGHIFRALEYQIAEPSEMTDSEKTLWRKLDTQPKLLDDLIVQSGLPPAEVTTAFLKWELEGFIVQYSGNRFALNVKPQQRSR